MSTSEIDGLKGTREAAIAAAELIKRQLQRYGQTGQKDAPKNQMKYCFQVVHNICSIVMTPQGSHCDVYCDILIRILAPYVRPVVSATIWPRLLEYVRYLHSLMVERKHYAEAYKIYAYVAAQPDKLQNDGDYKYVLSNYAYQLLTYRTRLESSNAAAEIAEVLESLEQLFNEMQERNMELNSVYPELMSDFVQYIMYKRSPSHFAFLSAIAPKKCAKMYKAFFTLATVMRMPQPSQSDLSLYCQGQLEAFLVFWQFDMADKLQQQLSLQLLRACRDQRIYQNGNKTMAYFFTLLYYYVKIIYSQSKVPDFPRTYIEACGKFVRLFEQFSGDDVLEKWIQDVLILMQLILARLQSRTSTLFAPFWQQMTCSSNAIVCFSAHLELINICCKLAPRITAESKLYPKLECCTSIRKHAILTLAQSALGAYSKFLSNSPVEQPSEQDQIAITELNTNLIRIWRLAIHVIPVMTCITNNSNDLKMLYAHLAELTRDVKTSAQSRLCLQLGEDLSKIKSKFNHNDWTLLLRRLYKTAAHNKDQKVAADLQCCYITSMLEVPILVDKLMPELRNQIVIYYTTVETTGGTAPATGREQCLLELYEHSNSKHKPHLEQEKKRLLHWLETQHTLKYIHQNKNMALVSSLLQSSQTSYDYVLLARASTKISTMPAKDLEKSKEKLQKMRLKMRESSKLNRLEQLTLGHVCTLMLHEQTDVQRKLFTLDSKLCCEENMEALLQRKELSTINIASELNVVQLALEALQAFEEFFNKADFERISSDDAYIDWEILMDDVASLALYLQYSGYMEHATQAWLLHYRVANTIDDYFNAGRALAYFCEHAEYFDDSDNNTNQIIFKLEHEVNKMLPIVLSILHNLPMQRNRHQNYVLVCLCQLAYYYARQSNFCYTQMLLEFVQLKLEELPERQGKYDIVLATIDAVKFRMLWKFGVTHDGNESASPFTAEFMHRCLLREVEAILDRFHKFAITTSSDTMPYHILLFSLTQQFAECTANRMCEEICGPFFVCILKTAFQTGSALRIVQILILWMWSNLQMENLTKAQTKLKLIECLMGVKNPQEFSVQPASSSNGKLIPSRKPSTKLQLPELANEMLSLHLNPVVEPMRRVANIDLTPLKIKKMQLSPSAKNGDLKRFLRFPINNNNSTILQQHQEIMQWIYMTAGCLNARLYFLVENFDQLEDFYDNCIKCVQQNKNKFLTKCFQNIQLLSMHHYANYLRAHKKYEKAQVCIETALDICKNAARNVDTIYHVVLSLQSRILKVEMVHKQSPTLSNPNKLRRALEFNLSPPEEDKVQMHKRKVVEQMLQKAMGGSKRKEHNNKMPTKINASKSNYPFTIYSSEMDRKQTLKPQPLVIGAKKPIKGQIDTAVVESSVKAKLNKCQAIDIIDLDADDDDEISNVAAHTPTVKKTNSSIRKLTKESSKTTPRKSKKIVAKRIARKNSDNCINYETIDLDDSLLNNADGKSSEVNIPEVEKLTAKINTLKITSTRPPTNELQIHSRKSPDCSFTENNNAAIVSAKSKPVSQKLNNAKQLEEAETGIRKRGRPRKINNNENIPPKVSTANSASSTITKRRHLT